MEGRALHRRCAGLKNVSMWMDDVLGGDGVAAGPACDDIPHSAKAFRAQGKSQVFLEEEDVPKWSSEARENFKVHDVGRVVNESLDLVRSQHLVLKSKLFAKRNRTTYTAEKENIQHDDHPDREQAGSGSVFFDNQTSGDAGSATTIENPPILKQHQPSTQQQIGESFRIKSDPKNGSVELSRSPSSEIGSHAISSSRANEKETTEDLSVQEDPTIDAKKHPPKSSGSSLLIPPPKPKKSSYAQKQTQIDENARNRYHTRQLIKAKWDARKLAKASRIDSSTRMLPDTSVAFLFGRRPFASFAEQSGTNREDMFHRSFNVSPELYPNQPALNQTADSAIERSIMKSGAQPIGCKERIRMLQNSKTKCRLERGQQLLAQLNHRPPESVAKGPHKTNRQRNSDKSGYFVRL